MTTLPTLIDCVGAVAVSATGPLKHLCPVVDETDTGTVAIGWRPNGKTIELHSLRAWLDGWAESRLSHEEITDRIHFALARIDGMVDVTVRTTWQTAGLDVEVKIG